jgi:DNA repair ATPase RecN
LPSTALRSKRLHDMLHSHHQHEKQANGISKHKRSGSSNDEPTSAIPSTGSPLKAASSLLQGLVSKPSNSYNTRHARSASALERIASRTPGLKNSPLASAPSSRRQSTVNIDAAAETATTKLNERVHPGDVLLERQKNAIRADEVREVYHSIEERAKSAEGRLEDVFGELQQKVRLLTIAIGELQGLVGDATQLQEGFGRESHEIEAEFKASIELFDSFEEQSKAVEGCERRIAEGKERVQEANERLEAARLRVEQWGKREQEWQSRTSSMCLHP